MFTITASFTLLALRTIDGAGGGSWGTLLAEVGVVHASGASHLLELLDYCSRWTRHAKPQTVV